MTVLNTYLHDVTPDHLVLMAVILIGAGIVSIICGVAKCTENKLLHGSIGMILGVAMLASGVIWLDHMPKEMWYEVLLDDNTPFVEVMDEYELVEQRGLIYVLKEKEGE